MKNLVRCLGIAALAAAVVLTMTACGPEEDPKDAPPDPVHIFDEYGPFTNSKLQAVYVQKAKSGEEGYIEVAYLWFEAAKQAVVEDQQWDTFQQINNHIISTGVTGTQGEFFTPTTAGSYTVAVVDNTTGSWTSFKGGAAGVPMPKLTFTKEPITIQNNAVPTNIKNFFGTWQTTAEFQPKKSDGTIWMRPPPNQNEQEPPRHENIRFTYREFDLQSTFAGNASYPGSKGDDYDADFEYVTFYIKNWTEKTSGLPQNYTVGYTLSVETLGFKGYSKYTSFNVFYNPGSEDVLMRRSTNNGADVIEREYKKLTSLP